MGMNAIEAQDFSDDEENIKQIPKHVRINYKFNEKENFDENCYDFPTNNPNYRHAISSNVVLKEEMYYPDGKKIINLG